MVAETARPPSAPSPPPSLSTTDTNFTDGGGERGEVEESSLSLTSSLTAGPVVTAYSHSLSDSDAEDMIAFDVQPSEGRLPQSSYTEEDSLFTWTDITGTCTCM